MALNIKNKHVHDLAREAAQQRDAQRRARTDRILSEVDALLTDEDRAAMVIVLDSRASAGASRRLDLLLDSEEVEVEPVPPHQARLARQAHRDFGRGNGHPARLNYGDCFAYALAIDLDVPLLFTGDDFTHTDVRPVPW